MARKLIPLILVGLALAGTAAAQETFLPASNLHIDKVVPIDAAAIAQHQRGGGATIPRVTNVVDPSAIYSDVTTYTGSAFAQGTAAGGITRLVADDVTFTTNAGVSNVTTVRFSVTNFNATSQSVRARLRFYSADGAALGGGLPNAPGTVIAGFSFNPLTFPPGTSLITGGLGVGFPVPAGATSTIWAGITYDNVGTTTGAGNTQLSNFGQGLFTPVDKGSSKDTIFETTAAGSFLANSPAGSPVNFGGAPTANMGWELVVTTLPVELSSFTID